MRYIALLNRGSNPGRVRFLLENVESIASHNGDCGRKQDGDSHTGAKEIEKQRWASKGSPKKKNPPEIFFGKSECK